ncbi:MAG TPA: AraC family transcriptional regulator [Armatimonadota bacterium]|jgi:AraC-like DNA-binding protein
MRSRDLNAVCSPDLEDLRLPVLDPDEMRLSTRSACGCEEMEFHLVRSGHCEFRLGRANYLCAKNSVILIHKNEQNSCIADSACEIKSIRLSSTGDLVADRPIARTALRNLAQLQHLVLFDEEMMMADFLLGKIAEEVCSRRLNWKRVAANHLETFLVILQRVAERHESGLEKKDHAIQEIVKYLDEKYMERPSLIKVSLRFGFSPYTLSKKFKQYTGLGFKEYLIHRCIMEARRLLEETNRKVASIAYEVGFESLSSFNGDFRRLTGLTPSAYRRIAGESCSWRKQTSDTFS